MHGESTQALSKTQAVQQGAERMLVDQLRRTRCSGEA